MILEIGNPLNEIQNVDLKYIYTWDLPCIPKSVGSRQGGVAMTFDRWVWNLLESRKISIFYHVFLRFAQNEGIKDPLLIIEGFGRTHTDGDPAMETTES